MPKKQLHGDLHLSSAEIKDSIRTNKLALTVSKQPCSSARTVTMSSMQPVENIRKSRDVLCGYMNKTIKTHVTFPMGAHPN